MGLYLKDKKVSPAIIQKEPVMKLGKPICAIDWDTDKLYIAPNPNIILIHGKFELDINGEKSQLSHGYTNGVLNVGPFKYTYDSYNTAGAIPSYDLSQLSTGKYNIKAKELKTDELKLGLNSKFNGIAFEEPKNTYVDSDYSDILKYERYTYTNSVTNLFVNNPSGSLNSHKYNEGKLLTVQKIPKFTNSKEESNHGFDLDENILTSTNNKLGNSFSYAKITFTLESDTEIVLKCRSYGESGYDYGIVSKIDIELSKSQTDDGATNSTKVLHNFKNEVSENWVDISFGTVTAGEHFFTIKYVKDSAGDKNDDNFKVQLPDMFFQIIDSGKYLPADIAVSNSNYPDPEYEYDPYTGKFKIPMTGNITMTAVGSDKELLAKFSITPSNWDVNTSILSWEPYNSLGVAYHIQTPDGTEYTTTKTSFDLTGKLGEPSTEYKTVKLWVAYNGNVSAKTTLKLIYNPGYEKINNIFEDYPYRTWGSKFFTLLETDDNIYAYASNAIYEINKLTGEFSPYIKTSILPTGAFSYFYNNDKHYYISESSLYAFSNDLKTSTKCNIGSRIYNHYIFGEYLAYQKWTNDFSIGKLEFYSFANNTYVEKTLPSDYNYNYQDSYIFAKNSNILYILCKDSSNNTTILEVNYNDVSNDLSNTGTLATSNIYTSDIKANSLGTESAGFIFDDLIIFRGGTFNIKTKEFSTDKYSFTKLNAIDNYQSIGDNRYIINTGRALLSLYLNKNTKSVILVNIKGYNCHSNIYNGKIVSNSSQTNSDITIKYFIP